MTHTLLSYNYEKRYWYPHMGPEDRKIWERFIEKYPAAFDVVNYDIPVGDGADHSDIAPENLAAGFKQLTQWKIDVVGYKDNILYVIEVKPSARAKALGQVLSYVELYKQTYPTVYKTQPMIITDQIGLNMENLAQKMGVHLVSVNP